MTNSLAELDRRLCSKTIENHLKQINSLPIDLAVILAAKSICEGEHKYLSSLREIATADELAVLDAKLAEIDERLRRYTAELALRHSAAQSEATQPTGTGASAPIQNIDCRALLGIIIAELANNGKSKDTALRDWCRKYGLSRTSVTDYRARRVVKRVSPKMCSAIEGAIRSSARELGL